MMVYRSKLYPHIKHESVRAKFTDCTRKIDLEVKKFLTNLEKLKMQKVKSKYNYVGSFLKSKNAPIPALKTSDSNILVKDDEKAEYLANFFESTFSPKNSPNSHFHFSQNISSMDYVYFDEEYIFDRLTALKAKINNTPDQIPTIFLKNCAITLARPLCHIFNFSMMSGKIPEIWKQSIVAPIPKKSNINEINNFDRYHFYAQLRK
jgi:hypothetical protein